jgi:AraC family transcriptional activator of tynA and feaB
MESSGDFNNTPELDYDGFIDVVRSLCGRYTPGGIEPETFSGRVRAGSICGFKTVDFSCNAHRIERMHRDVHFDGMEHYYAIFQTAGQSTILQNDQAVELAVGDVALVDSARPVTYVSEKRNGQWSCLRLPRQSLISHLGFEPEGGLCRHRETPAARSWCPLICCQSFGLIEEATAAAAASSRRISDF